MERSHGSKVRMTAGPVRPATSSLPGNSLPTAANAIPIPYDKNAKPVTQEFSVRVPNQETKQHNLMRFNGALKVDFAKWTSVKLAREDNSGLHKSHEWATVEMPKFGAGSEYGREQREEARRRKYGMNRKKYKPEDQPWILKESSKKYKGLREGGVNENASYFIFTQAPDGCFEVFPIKQWFNFTTIQRYKSLTAEEAEEQFSKRHKVVNHFSIMLQKRLRDEEGGGQEEATEKKGKAGKSDMKISDMDDWVDDDGIGDEEDSEEETEEKSSKKKKKGPVKKKKNKDSDDDANEDSDDGDEEGRELDYISDSSDPSEDEDEKKPEMSGVDQEAALRSLLESESSADEGGEKKKEKAEEKEPEEGEKKKKSKKKKKAEPSKEEDQTDAQAIAVAQEMVAEDSLEAKTEASNDAAETSLKEEVGQKRKAIDYGMLGMGIGPSSKKMKTEVPASTLQLAASEGITEDAVRKYLLRKPMTIAELLQKFKPKKSKIGSNDLVPVIAHLLKKINPTKRTQQNKMYFFLNKS